jgi:predicted ribosomally synthesized peptide with SipW-like signal peptide
MFNSKNTKRSLLMSALALVLCVSMLVGSTFAWFTDTASTGVNAIQSGTLDIQLLMQENDQWVSAEGKTLNFISANGNQNILWEPGCTYELPALKVVNNGNLHVKYQIHITGIEGDAKLLEVIDFTIEGGDALTGTLAPKAETREITLVGHMAEEAGNEYQTLTMDAISITVVATQLNAENDTYGPDYDEDAWHPAMKVYNANDLQAAINNGETNIVVMDDIALTESLVIPAAAATYSLRAAANAVTINLNGKTINNPNGYVFESQGNLILEGNGTVSGLGGTAGAGYPAQPAAEILDHSGTAGGGDEFSGGGKCGFTVVQPCRTG